MKKFVLPAIALFIILLFLFITAISKSAKEITSSLEIETLKQDINLDILINLGEFSIDNYSESKLLDIAMQYAYSLNLMTETFFNDTYLQYVSKEDLHYLIFELTGLNIEAPIEVEDFYYLYDSENDYYYYIGTSPTYYQVSKIYSIKRNYNNYFIKCAIQKVEDGETISIDNIDITLSRNLDASLIPYQIKSIVRN